MALFKILKGTATNLHAYESDGKTWKTPFHEGYCYFTTDEHQMWVDQIVGGVSQRVCLNAEWADYATRLGNQNIGSSTEPIYLSGGVPVVTEKLLPLTAGEDNKIKGALGLTSGVNYGATLPSNPFNGQLFFLEDTGASLPTGGSTGQVLAKNSATDADASWKSPTIGWSAGTTSGPTPTLLGYTGTAIPAASASASGIVTTGAQTFAGVKTMSRLVLTSTTDAALSSYAAVALTIGPSSSAHIEIDVNEIMAKSSASASAALYLNSEGGNVYLGSSVYSTGTVLYGAAWNDYAEYRTQQEKVEPGYCVASFDDGKVYKTTEKFQACDGIVSDTFGFAIGETDECKTPLAVAGRVLAYFHGERSDYHSGDTVCAGPEGKVMKMTREEIKEYPDRIVGIVSEIPDYKNWGTGNIEVNNRIWIKVK